MNRYLLTLVVAVFLVVGVTGWLGGMPKPAPTGSSGGQPVVVYQASPGAAEGLAPGATDDGTTGLAAAGAAPLDSAGQTPAGQTPAGQTAAPTLGGAASAPGASTVVADEWLMRVGALAAIPLRPLAAYAQASVVQQATSPGCHLGWNTLAAIGWAESEHGTHGGASIDPAGQLVGSILGPVLDGAGVAAVTDTDDGALDGDTTWDRAVGSLQFIPSTWAAYGRDGNGDGTSDPNQVDDAALAASAYLCAAGGDLATSTGWVAAVRAYNASDTYIDSVRTKANEYAAAAG